MEYRNERPLDTPASLRTRGNSEEGRAAMFGPLSRFSPSVVGNVIVHRRDDVKQHADSRRSYRWTRGNQGQTQRFPVSPRALISDPAESSSAASHANAPALPLENPPNPNRSTNGP